MHVVEDIPVMQGSMKSANLRRLSQSLIWIFNAEKRYFNWPKLPRFLRPIRKEIYKNLYAFGYFTWIVLMDCQTR